MRLSGTSNILKNMPPARHPLGETCPGSLPKYTSSILPQGKSSSTYLEVQDTNKLTQLHSGAALLCFAHLYVWDRVSTYKYFPARSRKGNICWANFTATTHRPSTLAVELLHKKDLPKPLLMCSGRPAVKPACPYTMENTTWTVNTKHLAKWDCLHGLKPCPSTCSWNVG